jgi:hypothetical protein
MAVKSTRILGFLGGAIAVSLTAGCFPFGGYYYQPSIQGATLVRLGCYGGAGPKNAAELRLDKTLLNISASREGSHATLAVVIYLSNHGAVRITEGNIKAWDPIKCSRLQIESVKLSAYQNQEGFRPSVPFKNGVATLLGGNSTDMFKNQVYSYVVRFTTAPTEFYVSLPFNIDKDKSVLPDVEFEWTYGIWPDTLYC